MNCFNIWNLLDYIVFRDYELDIMFPSQPATLPIQHMAPATHP